MIKAAIFDKDGTLFDFRASWGAWTAAVLAAFGRDANQRQSLGALLGYDPQTGAFARESIVIAHTTFEIADAIARHLGAPDADGLHAQLQSLAAATAMQPAVDLPATFAALRAMGLQIGLATNDTEAPARAHLAAAGVASAFDFVAGCDSGFGGKPAPGQLLAFAAACGLAPGEIAMVGDSVHDLEAAQRAGMLRVAVLTGIATGADLAPFADVVLPDISHLAGWIAARNDGL